MEGSAFAQCLLALREANCPLIRALETGPVAFLADCAAEASFLRETELVAAQHGVHSIFFSVISGEKPPSHNDSDSVGVRRCRLEDLEAVLEEFNPRTVVLWKEMPALWPMVADGRLFRGQAKRMLLWAGWEPSADALNLLGKTLLVERQAFGDSVATLWAARLPWQMYSSFLGKFMNASNLSQLAQAAEGAGHYAALTFKYSGSLVMLGPGGIYFSKNSANNTYTNVARLLCTRLLKATGKDVNAFYDLLQQQQITVCMEVVAPHLLGDHGGVPCVPFNAELHQEEACVDGHVYNAFFVVTLLTKVDPRDPSRSIVLSLGQLLQFCTAWTLPATEMFLIPPERCMALASALEEIRFSAYTSQLEELLGNFSVVQPLLLHRHLQGQVCEGFVVHRIDGDLAEMSDAVGSYRNSCAVHLKNMLHAFASHGKMLLELDASIEPLQAHNESLLAGIDEDEGRRFTSVELSEETLWEIAAAPSLSHLCGASLDDDVDAVFSDLDKQDDEAMEQKNALNVPSGCQTLPKMMKQLAIAYGHLVKLRGYRAPDQSLLLHVQVLLDDVFYTWRMHSRQPLLRGMVLRAGPIPQALERDAAEALEARERIVQTVKLKCGRYIARTFMVRNLFSHLQKYGEDGYRRAVANRLKQWNWPAEEMQWVVDMTNQWATHATNLNPQYTDLVKNGRYLKVFEPWLRAKAHQEECTGAGTATGYKPLNVALVVVNLSDFEQLEDLVPYSLSDYRMSLPDALPLPGKKKRVRPQMNSAAYLWDSFPKFDHLPKKAGSAVVGVFYDSNLLSDESEAHVGEESVPRLVSATRRRRLGFLQKLRDIQRSAAGYIENPSPEDWQELINRSRESEATSDGEIVTVLATVGILPGGGKSTLARALIHLVTNAESELSLETGSEGKQEATRDVRLVSSDVHKKKSFDPAFKAALEQAEAGSIIVHDKNIPNTDGLIKMLKTLAKHDRARVLLVFAPSQKEQNNIEVCFHRVCSRPVDATTSSPYESSLTAKVGEKKLREIFWGIFVGSYRKSLATLEAVMHDPDTVAILSDAFFVAHESSEDVPAAMMDLAAQILAVDAHALPRPAKLLELVGRHCDMEDPLERRSKGRSYVAAFLDDFTLSGGGRLHCTIVPPSRSSANGETEEDVRARRERHDLFDHWDRRIQEANSVSGVPVTIHTSEYVIAYREEAGPDPSSDPRRRIVGVWLVQGIDGVDLDFEVDGEYRCGQSPCLHITDVASFGGVAKSVDGFHLARWLQEQGGEASPVTASWVVKHRQKARMTVRAHVRFE